MDYQRIYDSLVKSRINTPAAGYSEYHHIIPRCIGGCDEGNNLVRLTAREHLIAHMLLVRIHPNNKKLKYALWACSWLGPKVNGRKLTARQYQAAREAFAEAQIGRVMTEESKRKLSDSRMGLSYGPHREDTKRKISVANSGKPKPEGFGAKLSDSIKGSNHWAFGKSMTDEDKAKREKSYDLLSPEGVRHQGSGLKRFCESMGLNQGAMAQVNLGKKPQYKGWKKYEIQIRHE